jgi:F-type H+-transporting ATPase subunit delta
MAETATLARPYAEALFKASGPDAAQMKDQLLTLAQLGSDPALLQFADNPKVSAVQVFDLVAGVALQQGLTLHPKIGNLLRAMLDNGRLPVLPEVASQFVALVNAGEGIADARIESAFPIDPAQLAEIMVGLEKRFGGRLNPRVELAPELIGGIRVTVGDEVLDTSVKARLEQMKLSLTA